MDRKPRPLPAPDGELVAPIATVGLSMPAARQALEVFRRDRIAAIEAYVQGARNAVSAAFEQLMSAEMTFFLGQTDQGGNKRNGFHAVRDYHIKGFGRIQVRTPRDRKREFESEVIPRYERMDPRLREDVALLHLAGISSRTMALISQRLLGLDVSNKTVTSSMSVLLPAAEQWLKRDLEVPYWALYIDGTNFKVQRRDSTESEPMLVVLGIDSTNHRSVLAVEPGWRENVDTWRAAFRELKRRGLDGAAVRVGVMDGLPGLEKLFRTEFPNAKTARCWIHALKNAKAKAPSRLREPFKLLANKVMYASSDQAAREAFAKLKEAMGKDAKQAVGCLERDLESLLVHYSFDRRFWLALKTSNPVERLHREIKRRTKVMDSIGEDNLTVIVAFTALKMELGWRQHAVDSRAIRNLAAYNQQKGAAENVVQDALEQLSSGPTIA